MDVENQNIVDQRYVKSKVLKKPKRTVFKPKTSDENQVRRKKFENRFYEFKIIRCIMFAILTVYDKETVFVSN